MYDSFVSEIPIDQGYEAVYANVGAENNWWGATTNFIYGRISTTSFGSGGAAMLPLSYIRNSVGISLLSGGMNFSLSVVIFAKRSVELFSNWQLDTFNKIMDAYNKQKQAYDEWLNAQQANMAYGFTADGSTNNPGINREIEQEELKKRCLEMFTAQRFESFDAATNGIQNVSGYPEILFQEAINEGNIAKFFEQAFEWEHMTYNFYPYYWGRKANWLSLKNSQDVSDPLFTKFLQAGYARVVVPARIDFENYLLMFNLLSNAVSALGCAWNFQPSHFGAMGISNEFSPGLDDTIYKDIIKELKDAEELSLENGEVIGHYVQKVPTNLVYIMPNDILPTDPLPGLPDNTSDPEISLYL